MNTLLVKLILTSFVLGLACGQSVSYMGGQKHPGVDDKCYLYETKHFIEFDDTLEPIGICRRYTCRDDFVVQINHCGRYMVPENCEVISRDLSVPYPDCCPKLKCINDDGSEDIRPTA